MIGQRFGNYRAVSLLGEGGMGAVYLAEHPEIGRRVAVKVLRPELIRDAQLLVRFLNEARAANAIRHPNIIEILDSGTTPDGTPYLVMELLEGEVLSARIKRLGRLALKDALEFSYQAASALAAAHGKGIIHRDLKPDNLFIVPDPSDPARELIKVLDFGIAKLQTMSMGGGMQTRTGTLMGTPVYMSPEQCLGTKTVDQRSDVYAMGIIMFEMLAGRPPFMSEGFGELVNMHLNVRPPSLAGINGAVTAPVEAVIAKALQKAPEARQGSAAALQADIRAAAGRSIVIRGASSPDLTSDTLLGGAGPSEGPPPAVTPAAFNNGPTTMSGATGERLVSTPRPPRRPRWLLFAVGGIAALGAGGYWMTARREASSAPPAPPAVALPEKVAATARVSIDSQPSGAALTDVASGTSLGVTPVMIERPVTVGALTLRVEKAGFVTLTRAFDFRHDNTEIVSLAPLPAEAKAAEPARPAQKPRPQLRKEARARHPTNVRTETEEEPAKL